jgi:hypothetical protein
VSRTICAVAGSGNGTIWPPTSARAHATSVPFPVGVVGTAVAAPVEVAVDVGEASRVPVGVVVAITVAG